MSATPTPPPAPTTSVLASSLSDDRTPSCAGLGRSHWNIPHRDRGSLQCIFDNLSGGGVLLGLEKKGRCGWGWGWGWGKGEGKGGDN